MHVLRKDSEQFSKKWIIKKFSVRPRFGRQEKQKKKKKNHIHSDRWWYKTPECNARMIRPLRLEMKKIT